MEVKEKVEEKGGEEDEGGRRRRLGGGGRRGGRGRGGRCSLPLCQQERCDISGFSFLCGGVRDVPVVISVCCVLMVTTSRLKQDGLREVVLQSCYQRWLPMLLLPMLLLPMGGRGVTP